MTVYVGKTLERQLFEAFGNITPYVAAPVSVCLCQVATSADESNLIDNEVTGGSYSRQIAEFEWDDTGTGSLVNAEVITWNDLPEVTVKSIFLADGDDNVLFATDLSSDRVVTDGASVEISLGSLKVRFLTSKIIS